MSEKLCAEKIKSVSRAKKIEEEEEGQQQDMKLKIKVKKDGKGRVTAGEEKKKIKPRERSGTGLQRVRPLGDGMERQIGQAWTSDARRHAGARRAHTRLRCSELLIH